jgi:hypothetical protein
MPIHHGASCVFIGPVFYIVFSKAGLSSMAQKKTIAKGIFLAMVLPCSEQPGPWRGPY